MKRILDFVENVATEGEFPENQFYLLVVDINIYWRLAHWLIAKENLTPWQMSTLLPLLGAWHPLKVSFCFSSFLTKQIAAEKVWSSFFPTIFASLFAFLWPESTILKKPRLSQLLSIFDLLFDVFVLNMPFFAQFQTRISTHLTSSESAIQLATSEQTAPKLPSVPSKKRRLSSAVLPVASSTTPIIPVIDQSITDVTHPSHVNHSHLRNLLDLLYVFIPVIKLYKAQLRDSRLETYIANTERILFLLVSCPSPSYISALLLQLQQLSVWKEELPQTYLHLLQNSNLLNEDLGEISLSKIRQYSPTIIQTPELLAKNYLSSGMYSSLNLLDKKVRQPGRATLVQTQLKNKISSFLLQYYFPKISLSSPYTYYSPLPSNVFKLNPRTSPPSQSSPFPIILKTHEEATDLLSKYAENCHKLLLPKKRGTAKAKKGSNKRKKNKKKNHQQKVMRCGMERHWTTMKKERLIMNLLPSFNTEQKKGKQNKEK